MPPKIISLAEYCGEDAPAAPAAAPLAIVAVRWRAAGLQPTTISTSDPTTNKLPISLMGIGSRPFSAETRQLAVRLNL
jgi:hypothetical protein